MVDFRRFQPIFSQSTASNRQPVEKNGYLWLSKTVEKVGWGRQTASRQFSHGWCGTFHCYWVCAQRHSQHKPIHHYNCNGVYATIDRILIRTHTDGKSYSILRGNEEPIPLRFSVCLAEPKFYFSFSVAISTPSKAVGLFYRHSFTFTTFAFSLENKTNRLYTSFYISEMIYFWNLYLSSALQFYFISSFNARIIRTQINLDIWFVVWFFNFYVRIEEIKCCSKWLPTQHWNIVDRDIKIKCTSIRSSNNISCKTLDIFKRKKSNTNKI